MLKTVIYSIICFGVFSSCVTEKQRTKICQSCALQTIVKDSIVERLIEVPVYTAPIAGPTLYLPSPCANLCDSIGNLKPFTISKKENGIKITVNTNIAKNSLEINSNLEDSIKSTAQVKSLEVYKSKLEQFAPKCQLKHVTGWLIFCQWFTIISVVCIAIWLFIKFK